MKIPFPKSLILQICLYVSLYHKEYILGLLYFIYNCLYAIFKEQMVGLNGLEPSTSRLSGVRSNQLSYKPTIGGDKEIRTLDPLLAKQVL